MEKINHIPDLKDACISVYGFSESGYEGNPSILNTSSPGLSLHVPFFIISVDDDVTLILGKEFLSPSFCIQDASLKDDGNSLSV